MGARRTVYPSDRIGGIVTAERRSSALPELGFLRLCDLLREFLTKYLCIIQTGFFHNAANLESFKIGVYVYITPVYSFTPRNGLLKFDSIAQANG